MHQNNKIVKAVVGILKNTQGEILIAERQQDQFMSGFWELPGGKIELGESNEKSLAREFKEELNVEISSPKLFHTMCYQYPGKTVYLWIYAIDHFKGETRGAEGQKVAWCSIEELNNFNLLPTMKAIIHKLTLPNLYWITPENTSEEVLLQQLQDHINKGIQLVQLRAKTKLDKSCIDYFYQACQTANVKLILNTIDKTYKESCDGWHLTTVEMLALDKRPCAADKLLGASTHNLDEALKAQAIDVDFIVISPVQVTQTHLDATPIGWEVATEVVEKINIPVYLLGGMRTQNLEKTIKLGAQGIAGVSAV